MLIDVGHAILDDDKTPHDMMTEITAHYEGRSMKDYQGQVESQAENTTSKEEETIYDTYVDIRPFATI